MTITLVRLYHDLLGTYGDQGNAEVLCHRIAGRGLSCDLVEVSPGDAVPTSGDIYLIGGGEDGPQLAALEMLAADGGLSRAVEAGAAVLAVCAGFQLIGTELPGRQGRTTAGLGLVDARTLYTNDPRSVGEVLARCGSDMGGEPLLTGFENHQGRTELGAGMQPLADVLRGVGNGMPCVGHERPEGVRHGRIFGTYLHGPVLARNPQLADTIITSVAGDLPEFHDEWAQALAAARRDAVS